jgi:hypothetical protein
MEKMREHLIVVGSGSSECLIKLDHELEHDRKYVIEYHDLLGGSGINYTFRLINAGFPAFPILAMGKDAAGELIRKELLTNTKKVNFSKQTIQYIDSDTFLSKNINTPRTTIIADKKLILKDNARLSL